MISVSLLIPVFNHEKFIPELFESIWNQDYKSIQIIAVDDGSSDGSYQALLKCQAASPFEMIVLKKSNGGICSALNLALKNATGDLVAVLASDDLLLPDRFSGQVELFSKLPDLKVLYNNGRYFVGGQQCGKVHAYSERFLLEGVKSICNYVTNEIPALFIQSILIRANFLRALGGFDEETNSDDWALNIRIFRALKYPSEFAYVDQDVFLYRAHLDQFHRSSEQMNGLIQKVMLKYLTPYQQADFKLKFEIAAFLRGVIKLDLSHSRIALSSIVNLMHEIKLTKLEIIKKFIYVMRRSILLKKYKNMSSKPFFN